MSKSKMRLMGALISMLHGLILGIVFSTIGILKSTGKIIIPAIIVSALISVVITGIIGFFIPIKLVSDKLAEKMKVTPEQKDFGLKYSLIQALVGDTLFTPLMVFVFIAKNVGLGNPAFGMAFLSSLLLDYVIAYVICFLLAPIVGKIMSSVMSKNPPVKQ